MQQDFLYGPRLVILTNRLSVCRIQ